MTRLWATATSMLAASVLVAPIADGADRDRRQSITTTAVDREGVRTEVHERVPRSGLNTSSRPASHPSPRGPAFETRYVVACEGNSLDSGDEVTACGYALAACAQSPGGGPLANVWRREVSHNPGRWRLVGTACVPPAARPGAPPRPGLSVEQVRSAFARTPFKRPVVRIQPPGGRTLINLPTYFEAAMPAAGYGPGQVHTVRLLGRTVRIRVSSAGYVFDFGDGTPARQSASAGGPYPDGDVRHTYARDGVYQVRVSARYRGEYSVDGSPWLPVGKTVTLNAAPVRLEVVTAPTRLMAD